MKNKNVIETFNSILPSNDEKEKILSNILNTKKVKSSKFNLNFALKTTALVSSLCIIFLLTKGYKDKPSVPDTRMTPMIISNFDIITFSYNDILYEKLGEVSDLDSIKGDLLFIVEDKNNPYFGAKIYKNKFNESTVLVYFNDSYEEYKIYE